MNQLKKLILKYCPNGVKWEKLEDITQISTGKCVTKIEIVKLGKYPVISGGKTPMGYINKYNRKLGTVTIARAGLAGYVGWQDKNFYLNDKCFSVELFDNEILSKYLYLYLKSQENKIMGLKSSGSVPTVNIRKLSAILVPIPPLPVQEEIVRILDKFTDLKNKLENKLKNELDLRKKQYEYYRDKLLSFEDGGVKHELLKYMIKRVNIGINPRKFFKLNPANPTGFYVTVRELNGLNGVRQYNQSDLIDDEAISILSKRSDIEEGDILFSNTGTVGKLALVISKPENWGVNEGICVIKPLHNIILSKFLYYFLDSSTAHSIYNKKLTGSTLKHITRNDLLKIKVPIPSLSVQQEIVEKLDRFNEMCNEITKGLPVEIQMREKQYEYYKDKCVFNGKNRQYIY